MADLVELKAQEVKLQRRGDHSSDQSILGTGHQASDKVKAVFWVDLMK